MTKEPAPRDLPIRIVPITDSAKRTLNVPQERTVPESIRASLKSVCDVILTMGRSWKIPPLPKIGSKESLNESFFRNAELANHKYLSELRILSNRVGAGIYSRANIGGRDPQIIYSLEALSIRSLLEIHMRRLSSGNKEQLEDDKRLLKAISDDDLAYYLKEAVKDACRTQVKHMESETYTSTENSRATGMEIIQQMLANHEITLDDIDLTVDRFESLKGLSPQKRVFAPVHEPSSRSVELLKKFRDSFMNIFKS